MPDPNFTFAFILSTLFGSVFHLIAGGDARRLALFLLSGWLGFGLGHFGGAVFGTGVFALGDLRIVPAVTGVIAALLVAHILTANRG